MPLNVQNGYLKLSEMHNSTYSQPVLINLDPN